VAAVLNWLVLGSIFSVMLVLQLSKILSPRKRRPRIRLQMGEKSISKKQQKEYMMMQATATQSTVLCCQQLRSSSPSNVLMHH